MSRHKRRRLAGKTTLALCDCLRRHSVPNEVVGEFEWWLCPTCKERLENEYTRAYKEQREAEGRRTGRITAATALGAVLFLLACGWLA